MTVHTRTWTVWVTAAGAVAGCLAVAPRGAAQTLTNVLQEARIEQRLNNQIPLELPFVDETGREVRLGDYFRDRPVVLVMAYYKCPMLCTLVLNGMVKALNDVELVMGRDFDVLTVSFDPRETPELAAKKKETYLKEYRREGGAEGWHFLTGGAAAISRLTEAVGFGYVYDAEVDQFAHGSGIMVATPAGRLSKYFYGIAFNPRDVRLGLVDASERRIGTAVDQLLLLCFHYNPVTGKYGVAIMRALQAAGAATVLAIGALLALALRRDRLARAGAAA